MRASPGVFIGGAWAGGAGEALVSTDPATGAVTWEGRAADAAQVESAVAAARVASEEWATMVPAARLAILEAFARALRENKARMAEAICRDVGKPRWEALGELD